VLRHDGSPSSDGLVPAFYHRYEQPPENRHSQEKIFAMVVAWGAGQVRLGGLRRRRPEASRGRGGARPLPRAFRNYPRIDTWGFTASMRNRLVVATKGPRSAIWSCRDLSFMR